MNEPNNTYSNEQGYSTDGYGMGGYESNPYGYSSDGYLSNGYCNQQSEPYGAPDYFANGYQENVFEGNFNLADTPWAETVANPNPHFETGVKDTNFYQSQRVTSYSGCEDIEL